MVIVAPGSTPPPESATVPSSVAVNAWARASDAAPATIESATIRSLGRSLIMIRLRYHETACQDGQRRSRRTRGIRRSTQSARTRGDVEGIVNRQGRRLDVDRVRRLGREFAELKEDPDLLRPFEDALRKAHSS